MMVAVGFGLSGFSIPIGASKCFPIQHMVNVLTGVILGPGYAVASAFCISLLRNMAGTGSLLAFPGSMIGAFCCGMIYKYAKNLYLAYAGEVIGTGIIGGIVCYPVATLIMGKEAAVFAYVLPFLISTAGGTIIAAILLAALYKSGAMDYVNGLLMEKNRA